MMTSISKIHRIRRRTLIASTAAAGAALLATGPAAATSEDTGNIALARRHLIDIWQDGKFEIAEQIFHPKFVDHSAAAGQPPGAAGLVSLARLIKIAMPDQHFEFIKLFAAGDLVVDHWILRATHTGPLGNIAPTGKRVEFRGTDIVRISDHRIIEIWHVEDMLTMFAQLGLVQPPRISSQID